jgi:hypothetical protein
LFDIAAARDHVGAGGDELSYCRGADAAAGPRDEDWALVETRHLGTSFSRVVRKRDRP